MTFMPTSAGGRWALGITYRGTAYKGWQSQPGGDTVQDHLERALSTFADARVNTLCAGRTDAGVHALNQVVHFDAPVEREAFSWVRGTNSHLPRDIAVQWSRPVADDFHARYQARGRRYRYVLLHSPVRPSLEAGLVGWVFEPLASSLAVHADYVLAINKKALQYLPAGADVTALTYTQLKDWGAAITKATNKRLLGFPAGPKIGC